MQEAPGSHAVVNSDKTYREIAKELIKTGAVEFLWLGVDDRPEHTLVFAVRRSVWRGMWLPSNDFTLYAGQLSDDDDHESALAHSGGTVDAAWADHHMLFHTNEEDEAFAILFNGVWRAWVEIQAELGVTRRAAPSTMEDVLYPQADDPFKLTLPE